jgi:hypothetical protein
MSKGDKDDMEITEAKRRKIYTTKTGAKVLGMKQDTLKHYAVQYGIGSQPGGFHTPWLFTFDELLTIRNRVVNELASVKMGFVEEKEDREELGLGPLYNEDWSPRK